MKILTRESPNFDERPDGRAPDMLIMHYTGMQTAAEAIERLCDPEAKVSAHYVVDEDGSVLQLVAEEKRAWHAGISHWAGEDAVNNCSIGIEIVNPGHEWGYSPFPEAQMQAIETLAGEIVARHGIAPARVLGHSDVAPDRKNDPGELFDWQRLANIGVGLWHDVDLDALIGGQADIQPSVMQEKLRAIGYGLEITGAWDEQTAHVVRAFQRHWWPRALSRKADNELVQVMDAVLARIA